VGFPKVSLEQIWRLLRNFLTGWMSFLTHSQQYHRTEAVSFAWRVITRKASWPKWVKNDASARPPSLPLPSCDLELWPPDPKVDHFMPLPRGPRSNWHQNNSFSKYCVHKFGCRQTKEWTGWEHYVCACQSYK